MIAVRAQELTALIARRAELHAHVDKLDAFQAREEKLGLLVNMLRPVASAFEVLRQRGIASIDIGDRLPGALSQLQRVQAVYREQRESFVDPQRSGFADFERTLNAFSSYLVPKVREEWEAYTRKQAQPLDPEVLRVLSSIPAYSDYIVRLQNLDRLVLELRASLPSDDVCDRFEKAVDERKSIWQQMQGADFSPEILNFLRRASARGAALDDLTTDVVAWIGSHGLSDAFRITMAPGVGP